MKNKILKIYLALCILISCINTAYSQKLLFNRLTPSDGLSQISINSIYQDCEDFIWIATRNGLNRYDGTQIVVYKKDKNNPNSLPSNNVLDLKGGNDGTIFLMCNDAVSKFNTTTDSFETIFKDKPLAIDFYEKLYIAYNGNVIGYNAQGNNTLPYYTLPIEDDIIKSILFDRTGRLWIGTNKSGLFSLETNGELIHHIKSTSITNLFAHQNGDVWCGTWSNGVYLIRDSKPYNYTTKDGLTSNFVRDITSDQLGNIWFATSSGVCKFDPITSNIEQFQWTDSNQSVWSMICDKQGNIWFGTYFGGVSWFNPEFRTFTGYDTDLLKNIISGRMTEDSDGNVWVCSEGMGVFVIDKYHSSIEQIAIKAPGHKLSPSLKSIFYDKKRDAMWFGTHLEGLFRYDLKTQQLKNYKHDPSNSTSIPSNIIRSIDNLGDKLILGTFNGAAIFDPESQKSEKLFQQSPQGKQITVVTNLIVDSNNWLWVAVEGLGVFTYNIESELLINYRHEPTDPRSLSSNNISTIIEDYKGNIWFGHEGSGVDRYNPSNFDFDNFDNTNNLLLDNRIYEICDNLDGSLSILTAQGFSILDYTNNTSQNFSNNKIWQFAAPNENSMFRSSDNYITIGGMSGLYSFRLCELTNLIQKDSEIKFNALYINQKEVRPNDNTKILTKALPFTDEIVLQNPKVNSFRIDFITSNYIPELEEAIEFKLEGFDKDWMPASGNQITYTNIKPGRYKLRLRPQSGNEHIKEASLYIIVIPPYYNTIPAWIIYVITIVALITFLLKAYKARVTLSAQVRYEQNRVKDINKENRYKLRFFTNISHEFRTPLAIIIGQIELLLRTEDLTSIMKKRVTNIYKSASELNSLIGELLDFRKLDQGHLDLKIAPANIIDMISDIYDIYNEYAASRGVRLNIVKNIDSLHLNCDVLQLRKVITNLLSNAIKHTSNGDYISIALKENAENVIISVTDTGCGIEKEDIEHIFERFYQSCNQHKNTQGGTGIGLAFAKGIVDLHNGKIEVTSNLGEGSRFAVYIPKMLKCNIEKEHSIPIDNTEAQTHKDRVIIPAAQEANEQIASQQDDRANMLIVEDDIQLQNMLVEIFSPLYNVHTAADGLEGVERAKEILPHIIVSDVMMPRMSGVDLCKTLKKNILTSHIPIILLTARISSEHTIEGFKYGADDYVAKPFNIDVLIARCGNLINNRLRLQKKFSQLPEENTYIVATNALDQKFMERALLIIEEHLDDTEFNISQFSAKMALSRTNLFNKIKSVSGQTPNEFIFTIRLKHAATLLLSNPELSISEISERTGFNSYRYFSRRFKERFGATPNAYRNSSKTNNSQMSSDKSEEDFISEI